MCALVRLLVAPTRFRIPTVEALKRRQTVHLRRFYGKKRPAKKIELREEEHSILDQEALRNDMLTAIHSLKWEFTNSVTTRITPAVVGNIPVSVGRQQVALREVAQISLTNPQSILVRMSPQTSPTAAVVKAVQEKIRVSAVAEGSSIRVTIPKPSKELRDSLAKAAKEHAEKAKVGIRRVRQKAISSVRKNQGVSTDSIRRVEDLVQSITDEHISRVEEMLKNKTDELGKV